MINSFSQRKSNRKHRPSPRHFSKRKTLSFWKIFTKKIQSTQIQSNRIVWLVIKLCVSRFFLFVRKLLQRLSIWCVYFGIFNAKSWINWIQLVTTELIADESQRISWDFSTFEMDKLDPTGHYWEKKSFNSFSGHSTIANHGQIRSNQSLLRRQHFVFNLSLWTFTFRYG